jgi:acyl-CoA synthetase (AMP-forming)/AMP-acid ligase II
VIHRSPYPDLQIPNATLGSLVLAAASTRLDHVALVDAVTRRALTYSQLLDGVRRTAAGIAHLGISKGDVVALWAPNSPQFAVVLHAAVRLGAIVTPTNPSNTIHELEFQLRDAGAKLLVTTAALATQARAAIEATGTSIRLLTIDEAAGEQSVAAISLNAHPPAVDIDPAVDIAVLPYSSGTTGLPKGVILTHRNLMANLCQLDAIEHRDLSALLGVLPFFHIYGLVVIMNFGLMRGLTVVTMP